jgi:hypothetical protein
MGNKVNNGTYSCSGYEGVWTATVEGRVAPAPTSTPTPAPVALADAGPVACDALPATPADAPARMEDVPFDPWAAEDHALQVATVAHSGEPGPGCPRSRLAKKYQLHGRGAVIYSYEGAPLSEAWQRRIRCEISHAPNFYLTFDGVLNTDLKAISGTIGSDGTQVKHHGYQCGTNDDDVRLAGPGAKNTLLTVDANAETHASGTFEGEYNDGLAVSILAKANLDSVVTFNFCIDSTRTPAFLDKCEPRFPPQLSILASGEPITVVGKLAFFPPREGFSLDAAAGSPELVVTRLRISGKLELPQSALNSCCIAHNGHGPDAWADVIIDGTAIRE